MVCAAWKQLAVLLLIALAVRLAAGVFWQSRQDRQSARFTFGDSESYWTLGETIARGEPYRCGPEQARVFRTPGYPILLAPLFLVATKTSDGQPPILWARAESALFGTLVVVGVWWLARSLFDAKAGLIAGLVAALYPEAVASSAFVLTEAPFCALMLLQMAFWTIAWKSPSPRRTLLLALLTGVVAGLATLVRPSWLLFTPGAIGFGLLFGSNGRTHERTDGQDGSDARYPEVSRLRHAWIGGLVMVGMIAAMAPWWIRNARLAGRFIPTTLQVGASLYDGLNPRATGASDMALIPQSVAELRRRMAEGRTPRGIAQEIEEDRLFREAALAFVREEPGRAVRLAAIKLRRIWNVWPNEASFASWPVALAVAASYLPVLVLGIVGAARTLGRGWPYSLCWLPAVYFTLLHVTFVGSIRYRLPGMMGLIVLAAGALAARNELVPSAAKCILRRGPNITEGSP